jgi:hypothetical protein
MDTGRALTGTCNSRGVRYYKPYHGCTNRYQVNADLIERRVLNEFFQALGSQKGLRDAVYSGNSIGKEAERLQDELRLHKQEFSRVEARIEKMITSLENCEGDVGGPATADSASNGEGNSPAHIKTSLMGPNLSVLVSNHSLLLGTWQGVFLCEFDGPRTRKVHLKLMAG